VPDSETSKSLKVAFEAIRKITAYAEDKRVFVIALGGGVVGDLAGFVSSVYKRGVAYIQVPTTLLAQADSSIGGKTGVDLTEGKNLVGTFYQPRLVCCDVALLKTLSAKQIKNGLAEIIKCAVIKNRGLFVYLEKLLGGNVLLNPKQLERILLPAITVKARIVEADEKEEKGLRTILNFGHTIGHAIEAAGRYRAYNHGEAVGLGMLVATDISRRLGLITPAIQKRVSALIKSAGLPDKVRNVRMRDIISRHYRDKKFIGSQNRFVLISGIGKAVVRKNIPLALIKESIQKVIY
jgi:3-dehydroquinate synthase